MNGESNIEEYHRAYAEIALEALRKNVLAGKARLPEGTGIIAVVKADAYGHGAVQTAEAVRDLVAGYAVATLDEALELRNAGIDSPILILGYISPKEYREAVRQDIILSVYSYGQAEELSKLAVQMGRRGRCHIKVDTGMNRIGLPAKRMEDIEPTAEVIGRIKALPNLICDGIFTHFATADGADKSRAGKQYDNFCRLLDVLKEKNITFTYRHCSNSAAIIDMPECTFEWVRQGITLYGLKPSETLQNPVKLYPVMSLKCHVVHIKTIHAGDEVGYEGIYRADCERRIATISIGYGDGYPRSLSNKGYVLIRGKKAPITGRICMDQLMVDITDIPQVELEDEVTLMGEDNGSIITAEELGNLSGRFNYELVCDINKRVKRIYK